MKFNHVKSHAKINLALNVVGKSSRLHLIESIIAFINLYDIIYIKEIKSKKHQVSFFGKFSKNISKKNTISELLKILDDNYYLNKKFFIKVKKLIPTKSGLGGGSMNAAAVLNYFLKKKIVKIDKKRIIKISKLIGEDVILGLMSTYLIINSKNKIKQYKISKKFYTLIVKPNFGCSTKSIYSGVKKFEKAKFNNSNKNMFNKEFLKKMHNSLEPIAFSKYPKLEKIKSYLEKLTSPLFVRMSGSGSAIVAYFQTKKECDKAMTQFRKEYKKYWCISSKTI
jgi:4-diphosphocytidyl-2-C-methyl-D-erythritol kinase